MMASAVSFISRPLDLLAQIFGGAAHHQPADEHRQDGVQNHVHEAHALAAKDTVEHHVQHRHHSAQRRQGVVHVVDGACGEGCCYGGKQSGLGDAEADFLALHAACGLVEADLRQSPGCPAAQPSSKGSGQPGTKFPWPKRCCGLSLPSSRAVMPSGWADSIFSPGRVLLILETSVTHHLAKVMTQAPAAASWNTVQSGWTGWWGSPMGVAELRPKKPPPLVPRCLMISSAATRPHPPKT